ncbi:hypothetical protein [Arenibacter algicola]|uniref:GDSL-like lipase/acylhydrolase family protein n=1 Tax=Arenibacter algicola TaxID=616991 RepID=A0A221UUC4_9FLAO|nr:hypothetical protein [Arenibacter algicola]ASO04883.1 hypothetical protein AREALGSMS7_01413 [Arenibacter algicola]
MSYFPSNKTIIFTQIVIMVYLTIDFQINGKRDFFQLNYDWNSIRELNNIADIKIDSVSYNFLNIELDSTKIDTSLNTNNSYCINDKYYFRSALIRKAQKKINFHGVYWINDIPTNTNELVNLSIIDLPINQNGERTVCMIGDSQLNWLEGKHTRKDIANKIRDIKFVGHYKDVFGYPHQAFTLNNSNKIVNNLKELPYSQTYVLFIGAHESVNFNTEYNIEKIVSFLLNKNSHLILIIPPNFEGKDTKNIHKIIKSCYLQYRQMPNVKIIDLSKIIDNPDLFLMKDRIHLNLSGHNILTKYLIDALN